MDTNMLDIIANPGSVKKDILEPPFDSINAFKIPFFNKIHCQIKPTTTGERSTGKKKTDRKKPRPIIFLFKITAVSKEKKIIRVL